MTIRLPQFRMTKDRALPNTASRTRRLAGKVIVGIRSPDQSKPRQRIDPRYISIPWPGVLDALQPNFKFHQIARNVFDAHSIEHAHAVESCVLFRGLGGGVVEEHGHKLVGQRKRTRGIVNLPKIQEMLLKIHLVDA
jgi:hypothetical protein